ncbi:MAG: hypothetical protein ACLUZQ_06730 [Butyricicoccus sp.]
MRTAIAGFLHGCEGDIIDFEAVADAVVQAAQNYDLRMVGFDRIWARP